ncbi:cofilin actophorin [Penicillium citrinum]|uniref:Cofilin n=2 Tax=Penicillium TaxID=5073 RepID=A0A9W9P3H6_PENCI|nr:cofilin actophorin [Penicillium citrinum]KAJ5234704.1 cofilin actophorin [Penicillium citrinum]
MSCLTAFNELKLGRGSSKPKFIIYGISNNYTAISLKKSSSDTNWEDFLRELSSSVDENGIPAPRYAAYDVEYDLGADGKRSRVVFIAWVPIETSTKVRMIYASTKEQLRKALDVSV